jgi:hypothetical protein
LVLGRGMFTNAVKHFTLGMLTRQARRWDRINLEEVPLQSARAFVKRSGGAMRDLLGRDNAFARAVVAELALRYRDQMRALKGQ